MSKLLLVDDEPNVRYSLEKALKSQDLEILLAGSAKEGIEQVRHARPDAVVLDVRLPDMSGLDAYQVIRQVDPRLPVIVITAFSTTNTAIEAMKMGAFEYLLKPLDLHRLREVVGRAIQLNQLNRQPEAAVQAERGEVEEDRLVGRSAPMQELYKAIGRVAPQDVTVLILGESGSGKELVARAIWQHSRRGNGPMLAINCAAIPESLLESELFGHEKGSFTGADKRRIGKFEQASGGTIFMDEVGDMSLATQSKVLRLLQDQQFERVGGNETVRTDVRVIAATNQDLPAMVAAGRFRQDLYYRLNVFTIHVPPLRQRRSDIPLLIEHFLAQASRKLGRQVRGLSPDALDWLQRYAWPGNVRELQSVIKYAVVHTTGEIVTPDALPENVRAAAHGAASPQAPGPGGRLDVTGSVRGLLAAGESDVYHKVHAAVDRVVLDEVLRHVRGNQVDAAEILGVSRNTLRSRLRQLGMSVERQVIQAGAEDEGHHPS